ncbi:MAG: hypothetical protein Q9227_001026 [Pyrenula ochraceoflavens]
MASTGLSSHELTVQPSGQAAFSQTGQVDWVAFSRATSEATISILTRLSGSQVEPLTALVAQQISTTFHVPVEAEQRIGKALSRLVSFGSFGDAVWFGFGIRHLIRSLAQTREGTTCVALCAALTEAHTAEFASLVMTHLTKLMNAPQSLSPSIAQWRRLVDACAGCLLNSDLPEVVRRFSGFNRSTETAVPEAAPDPEDLARALLALSKLSSGHLDSITLASSADCAWLGAIAEWLLGLSVILEQESPPNAFLLGTYAAPNKQSQVRIIYTERQVYETDSESLVVQKAYKIRQISDVIRRQMRPRSTELYIRVPWTCILAAIFGEKPVRVFIVSLRSVFIAFVGSVARIFEGMSKSETGIERDYLETNIFYLDGTYGRGFLHNFGKCFPELATELLTQSVETLALSY